MSEEPGRVEEAGETKGQLDAKKSVHIFIAGRKRSGKSELGWRFFESWPYDRVLIDPNGDLEVGETSEDLESPIPSRWPPWPPTMPGRPPKRRTLRFVPDILDPAHEEEMDRACGLAYGHPKTLLFVDECQHAAPASEMAKHPHMKRNLAQSRHGGGGTGLSMILISPRPMTIDPLCIAQADLTYIFKLPNPADRKRVADCIGYDPKALDEAIFALGPHEYLGYDVGTDELTHYPPLPKHLIVGHAPA